MTLRELFSFKWLSFFKKGLDKTDPTLKVDDRRKKHNIESNCVSFDDDHFKDD